MIFKNRKCSNNAILSIGFPVVEDIYFRDVQVKKNKKAYVSIFNTHAFVNRIAKHIKACSYLSGNGISKFETSELAGVSSENSFSNCSFISLLHFFKSAVRSSCDLSLSQDLSGEK